MRISEAGSSTFWVSSRPINVVCSFLWWVLHILIYSQTNLTLQRTCTLSSDAISYTTVSNPIIFFMFTLDMPWTKENMNYARALKNLKRITT